MSTSKFTPLLLVLFALATFSLHAQISVPSNARIALSFDGDLHDTDDFGAMPLSLAILSAAGKKSKVVYTDYNSHPGCTNSTYATEMGKSKDVCTSNLSYSSSIMYNMNGSASSGESALKTLIQASTSTNPLVIIVAGPFHHLYRSMSGSTSAQRKNVYIVSHSTWNENHNNGKTDNAHPNTCKSTTKTWSNVKSDYSDLKFVDMADQNGKLGNGTGSQGNATSWSFLNTASNWSSNGATIMKAVHGRITTDKHNNNGRYDVSDAGMAMYVGYGLNSASITDVKNKLVAKWGAGTAIIKDNGSEVLNVEQQVVKANVYPTNFQETLSVDLPLGKTVKTAQLVDMNGKVVHTRTGLESFQAFYLTVSDVSKGSYVLRLIGENSVQSEKVVKL